MSEKSNFPTLLLFTSKKNMYVKWRIVEEKLFTFEIGTFLLILVGEL